VPMLQPDRPDPGFTSAAATTPALEPPEHGELPTVPTADVPPFTEPAH